MIIRFQDCDPLRHLNNAKYFDYFFNAREDQVARLYGFTPADVYRQFQTGWVVYKHEISYLRPANVSEWVRIFSRLLSYDQDTILMEYFMTDDEKSHLKTVLWTTMKYVQVSDGRKTPHQPLVEQYLSAICYRGYDPATQPFQSRIRFIKDELASGLNYQESH